MHPSLPAAQSTSFFQTTEVKRSSLVAIRWAVAGGGGGGCCAAGGIEVPLISGACSFQETLRAAGVPVMPTTPMVGGLARLRLYARKAVAVGLSCWAPMRLSRFRSGPKATSLGVCPARTSDFCITQVSSPTNAPLPLKSFQLNTTLSVLTPRLGWSSIVPGAVGLTWYTVQKPPGSQVSDTAR